MLANYKALFNKARLKNKSDASLVCAYAGGDASAFDVLYARYKDSLFNSLYHQLGANQEAAEEVAQDVWMAVIRGAESFEDVSEASLEDDSTQRSSSTQGSSFRSWLFSIGHRRCADFWRRHYRRDAYEVENGSIENGPGSSDQAEDSEQERQQLVYEFRKILAELPEEQRQSFILKEEGFSYQEIAEITETGTETVKSRLRYARETLKQRLNTGEFSVSKSQVERQL